MKIFSWMQSKLNAKQKPNTAAANNHMPQATSKEEFSDWPQALLAIGTFGIGTSGLKEDPERERHDAPCQSHPRTPTPEEVGELQEDVYSLLDTPRSESVEEAETQDPPSDPTGDEFLNGDIRLQQNVSGVFSKGKDIFMDNRNNVIRKKSLTFLLKKIFTPRSRFSPASLVRDSLAESTIDGSRMEKVLRAILNKKIHPQSSTAKAMPKKYLERKDMSMGDSDDEMPEASDGSIWVKTDSEYIVLEI